MTDAPIRIGFHPLVDCAALVVAEACGYFESEGLSVTLSREPSWANIRDKLAYGLLEAAHALAPMPLAAAARRTGEGGQLIAPLVISYNGNSVFVTKALADALGDVDGPAQAGRAVAELARTRRDPLVFAVPFPVSPHAYVLRQWLAASGLDPERDVSIVVCPPVRMTAMVGEGLVDAFCVGAPWGQAAALAGLGRILFSDQDYWPGKPEKVLAVSETWEQQAPDKCHRVVRALMRGAHWADDRMNRSDLVSILARPDYVGASAEEIAAAFDGSLSAAPVFAGPQGGYVWPQHAEWFLKQMIRWGHAPDSAASSRVASRVCRPDLWTNAADSLGLRTPKAEDFPGLPNAIGE